MRQRLILGGPGCGKTERLMGIVEQEMADGIPSQDIAYVSFTTAAANEAKQRAAVKFNADVKEAFPWFRTIHSLCFKAMEFDKNKTMDGADWAAFADIVGEKIGRQKDALFSGGASDGDRLKSLLDFSHAKLIPLEEAWHQTGAAFDWHRIKRFNNALARYKEDLGKIDFSDMISEFNKHDVQVPVRVAIIDEAQDLTVAQWVAMFKAFDGVDRMYIAGDDDQVIYHWAGADIEGFHMLEGEREVLPHSHRLPQAIFDYSQQIARRISKRFDKQFTASSHKGRVEVINYIDQVDLRDETWFLLARNAYLLKGLQELAYAQGVTFVCRGQASVDPLHVRAIRAWETLRAGKAIQGNDAMRVVGQDLQRDELYTAEQLGLGDMPVWYEGLRMIPVETREYYQRCMRNGDLLDAPPRVRIDTIHAVKGGEADNVLVLCDISGRTEKALYLEPDSEHRVFYVAVTRAKQALWLVQPQTKRSYQW